MALGVLSKEAIDRAIGEFDELGRDAFLSKYGFGRATHYALVVDGREYDPKAIAGVAHGFDHPDEGPLKNTHFNGGIELRKAYEPAGYDVVLKVPAGETAIQQSLEQFMGSYLDARRDKFTGSHPIMSTMNTLVEQIRQSGPVKSRPNVMVKGSSGQGNWAFIPWIAFLDDRETTTTKTGVYPVLLFSHDMSGVFVTVAQGTTELRDQLGRREMLAHLQATATRVRRLDTSELAARGFALDNSIFLGDGTLARDYAASTIAFKYYERGQVPEDLEILRDLDAVLELSDRNIESTSVGQSAVTVSTLDTIAIEFRAAVDSSGLRIPRGHGDLVISLLAALVTKPFVILSGLSGSGKTQLALRLGEWFGSGSNGRRFLPVAVRPDWTGPEALFGYEDALRPPADGRAAWFVPDTLRFLLSAADEPDMPHLLLLDEMNLAHVERYFSDFLSGFESRDAVLPNLALGDDGEWRLRNSQERLVAIPRNVFVIGTVNVDETTYQFSPKVLDRATTFEVRTSTDDLVDDVVRPNAVHPAEVAHLRGLVELALDDTWQRDSPGIGPVANALRDLHGRLAETNDEFGHRVFYESLRFAAALAKLGVTERNHALDHLVLLKVLPKIHGSRRRAEPVLKMLADFGADPDGAPGHQNVDPAAVALPLSVLKIQRMLRDAEVNQFVSFTV
ncbi:McrB family protein [Gordonia sp. NPDC058843]|uniref:McrB family protein n=1 Tax=Gordonia sp. NPDC058843 TaxID=3346648 RepID=UPI0036A61BAC